MSLPQIREPITTQPLPAAPRPAQAVWGWRRLAWPLLLAMLFLAGWLPRVVALDRYVTIDERKWLTRSANFALALNQGDWAKTFQREHPGVTVMWAGALGLLSHFPDYPQVAPGQFTWEREHFEAWLRANTPHQPVTLLAAGRWWMTLWIAGLLAIATALLAPLVGRPTALLAGALMMWDPFHLALSRQLHLDGLVSSLMLVALLALLVWLHRGHSLRILLLSSAAMALAWLTKSPAILLVPVGVVLTGLSWWRQARASGEGFRTVASAWLLPMLLWGGVTTLLFFALWPAMWMDPVGTLGKMASEASEYVERHTNTNYFMGQVTEDPGLLFYPVAYLFRTSPLVLLGLAGTAWLFLRRRWPFEAGAQPGGQRALVLTLLGFALFYALVISVGAKKFDRYLLPIFLPLDIIAALGLMGTARALLGRWQSHGDGGVQAPRLAVGLLAAALLLHGLPGFWHYPYYLTYFNPALGGSAVAPRVLWVGWGEGLDQVAAWLNAQPGAEQLRVAAWYADGPFSYYFRGQNTVLNNFDTAAWLDSDYMVLYANGWQREGPSPEALAWFATLEPALVVQAGGLELARLYDVRTAPPPDFLGLTSDQRADFSGQIRLLAADIERQPLMAGDRTRVTFHLQNLAPIPTDLNVLVRLVGPDGQELWRNEGWPWGAPTSQWPRREIRPDGHEIVIPEEARPGLYALTLNFYDPATFEPLVVTGVRSDQPTGEPARVVDLIQVGPLPEMATRWEPGVDFGPANSPAVVRLKGATLPERVTAGEALPIEVLWESAAKTTTDYTVFVHLIGPDGNLVAQHDSQPLGGFAPTRLWEQGEGVADRIALALPAGSPAGAYTIRVGLYTLDGGRLAVQAGAEPGDALTLGTVQVTGEGAP